MKRFFAICMALCLVVAAMAGCGQGSANYNVKDIASSLESTAKIENPIDFTEDDLTYEFNIDMAKVDEFAGQNTRTNGASGTVLVVKAKAGGVEDVKAALEAYRDGRIAVYGTYKDDFPDAYAQVSEGRVVTKGDYAVLAIAAAGVSYDDLDKAVDEAFK